MSTLRVYACGGTGINIASKWIATGANTLIRKAQFIGLDSSENNKPYNDAFKVERPEGTRGGGKERKLIGKIAAGFIDSILTKHKPGDFNLIIMNAAGATGSTFGPTLINRLLTQGVPVIALVVGDLTSELENYNTVKTFESLDNQRINLNVPVIIDYVDNAKYPSRGLADKYAIGRLDILSLFLTDEHEESDFQDIRNLFYYNQVTKAAPTLARIDFLTDTQLDNVTPGLVAEFGLYRKADDIGSHIKNLAYRSTGVIQEGSTNFPAGIEHLHMVFDHDATIKDILVLVQDLKDIEIQNNERFKSAQQVGNGGDDSGMSY
ncbi:putative tubulin-like protein [Klebsiella phage KPN8]|nr:putative tubulin-like protein [Klebsiella phage KPN8]